MSYSEASYIQGGMYETEPQRLQREADEYTKKLEHERKRYLILEDQHKQMQSEFDEKKEKIKEMIPSEEDFHQQEVQRRHYLHMLANERVRLNDTVGRNNHLKNEINIMRKEILFAKDSISKMSRQINKIKKDATSTNKDYISGSKQADETNNQILALKAKHEEEKDRFELEIKKLQERLKERDEPIEFDDKNFNQTVIDTKGGPGSQKQEFANPIAILKLRLNKVIGTNKEKKRLLDQYMRNARIIEDAFDQIKEATGISSIEEIVTTFVKAEEQNYSLYNFVNLLNQETDSLEESNRQLDADIEYYNNLANDTEGAKQARINQLQERADSQKDEIMIASTECEEIQSDFTTMQKNVQKMIKLFANSKFYLSVANSMSYDEETQFNESNITQYLAELEEYISSLITYVAFKKDDPNAAISSVPLDKLNQKEFHKKEIQIDAPIDTERDVSMAKTDIGEDEDVIIDSKQLYMKFLDMVGKKQINIVHQSQAKREQAQSQIINKDE